MSLCNDPACLYIGDSTPSPNTYGLPTLLGSHVPHRSSSASYSLTGRPKTGGFVQNSHTPGANAYKVIDPEITGQKAPVFSLYSRNYMPGGKTIAFSIITVAIVILL